mgnify:CR=1 FL=1
MERILIIQSAFIGDVVLATPIIEKLAVHFPEAKIDFLLKRGNQKILQNHPKLNKVYIWKQNEFRHLFKLSSIFKRNKYDLVLNLQRTIASGLITVLSGAKVKIGFSKNPFSFLFDEKVFYKFNGKHESSRNLGLIQSLTDKTYISPKLYPQKMDYAAVAKYQEFPYLCIAPSSYWKTKEFPQVKWIELIISLDDHWIIYLLGGKEDFSFCEEIRTHAERKNVINLAGKLEVLASAALMEKAKMNYVNDSSPLHIASAMNASINAVFCSSAPYFGFGPLTINSKVIEVEKELSCKPCAVHGKNECPLGHFDCAHSINIKQFDKPKIK